MKFPIQVQFHRPEFLKSDNHPTLKAIFQKEKDKPLDANNRASQDQALRQQQSQASRHRLFGGLVTWNKNNASKAYSDPTSLINQSKILPPIKQMFFCQKYWTKVVTLVNLQRLQIWITTMLTY